MAVKLGDLLIKAKLVSQDQVDAALKSQREEGGKFGEALVRIGACTEADITETLSQQFGVPSIDLSHFEIDPNIIKIVPGEVARKYGVLPVNKTGATLTIAMGDPTNVFAMDDIKFMTGYNVEPVVASEIALRKAIEKHYGTPRSVVLKQQTRSATGSYAASPSASLDDVMASSALTMDDMAGVGLGEMNMDEITGLDAGADVDVVRSEEGQEIDLSDLAKSTESAPIIKVSNLILIEALKAGASDIHIEPYEKEFRVRFRVDGVLHNIMALPMRTRDPLISRLKIMAKLDISEKRLPQDGRIKIRLRVEERSRDLDLRVSTVPAQFGEKVVMRLLDKSKLQLDMTQLGFEQEPLRRFKEAIDRPYGIVLVTGPTGSGKTNTLYSAIAALNDPTVNIMTAEDPIEFNLAGINQVQMKEQIGLTFASALRSFLRQDPDIILVGEMRDAETMEVALHAAETGHLVLSTLHTLNATETVNRVISTFPPHQEDQIRGQLSAVTQGIVSQRLVVRADGKGRVPAVEVMVGTGLIRDCIKEADKTSQIPSVIAAGQSQYGMQTFDQSLLGLYREELISYEVARDAATNPDDFDLKVKGIFSTGEMTWETSGTGQQAQPGAAPGMAPRPAPAAPEGPSGTPGPFSKRP